jgi:hypothetical protein
MKCFYFGCLPFTVNTVQCLERTGYISTARQFVEVYFILQEHK